MNFLQDELVVSNQKVEDLEKQIEILREEMETIKIHNEEKTKTITRLTKKSNVSENINETLREQLEASNAKNDELVTFLLLKSFFKE